MACKMSPEMSDIPDPVNQDRVLADAADTAEGVSSARAVPRSQPIAGRRIVPSRRRLPFVLVLFLLLVGLGPHMAFTLPAAGVETDPCASTSGYSGDVLAASGLLGYWRLGDRTGPTACEARGEFPGTYSGGYTLGRPGAISGDANTAAGFNGTTSYARVANSAGLNPTSAITLEGWVSPVSATASQTLIRKDAQYMLRIANSTVMARLWWSDGTYTEFASPAVISGGGYQHLAVTYDGSTARLLRNGVVVASRTVAKTIRTGTAPLYLGTAGGYDSLNGQLDEVALYGNAVPADTLAEHYRIATDTVAPAAPGGVTAEAGDGSVGLSWSANPETDLASYRVYRRVAGDAWPSTATQEVDGTSWTDTTAVNSTTYDYRVTAVDASNNESTPSAPVTATPILLPGPCASTSAYSGDVLAASGLLGYWRLGDRTGPTACEARGEFPGTYSGGYTLGRPGAISGDANTAAGFNGTTSYARVANSAGLNPTSAITLEGWVSPVSATASQTLIRKDAQYMLRIANSTVMARLWWSDGTYTEFASPAVISGGDYQHLAVTYDGSTARLFRNGVVVASRTVAKTIRTGTGPLYLGTAGGYDSLNGQLDEVALYGNAVPADTLAEHYRIATDTVAPAAPGGVTAEAGDGSVGLSWSANPETDLASYRVYRRVAGDAWPSTATQEVDGTSWTDTTAVNSTTYDYRVTAVDASNNESTPSAPVTATPILPGPCASTSGYSGDVLAASGLLGYWRLGDRTGPTACEARGEFPGTYSGGYTLGRPGAISGDANTAAGFNGTTSYARVPNSAGLNPTSAITLEGWVSPVSATASQTLIRKDAQYMLRIANSTVMARLWWSDGTYTEFASPAVISGGGYQHVAVTYDGSTARLFHNGVVVASRTVAKTIRTGTGTLYLGTAGGYDSLNGQLDEVALYGNAVPADTMAEHHRKGAGMLWRSGAATNPGFPNHVIPSSPVLNGQESPQIRSLQGVLMATDEYAEPVYYSNARTELRLIRCVTHGCVGGTSAPIVGDEWVAPGTDGQLVIVDSERRRTYEFYQTSRDADGTVKLNSDGSITVGSMSIVDLDGRGNKTAEGGNLNITGAGLSRIFGVVRADEVKAAATSPATAIPHALQVSMPAGMNCAAGFREPATKTDGRVTSGACVQEGARFQLDPTYNCDAIVTRMGQAVCFALQKYGAYNADSNGSNYMMVYGQHRRSWSTGDTEYAKVGIWSDYENLGIPTTALRSLANWSGD